MLPLQYEAVAANDEVLAQLEEIATDALCALIIEPLQYEAVILYELDCALTTLPLQYDAVTE